MKKGPPPDFVRDRNGNVVNRLRKQKSKTKKGRQIVRSTTSCVRASWRASWRIACPRRRPHDVVERIGRTSCRCSCDAACGELILLTNGPAFRSLIAARAFSHLLARALLCRRRSGRLGIDGGPYACVR